MKKQLTPEEGVEMPDGRTIEIGALKVTKDAIAVMLGFDFNKSENIVGTARNLTREDGKLFMDFHVDEKVDLEMWDAHVWANHLSEDREKKVIASGEIRCINLTPVSANPMPEEEPK